MKMEMMVVVRERKIGKEVNGIYIATHSLGNKIGKQR